MYTRHRRQTLHRPLQPRHHPQFHRPQCRHHQCWRGERPLPAAPLRQRDCHACRCMSPLPALASSLGARSWRSSVRLAHAELGPGDQDRVPLESISTLSNPLRYPPRIHPTHPGLAQGYANVDDEATSAEAKEMHEIEVHWIAVPQHCSNCICSSVTLR